MGLRRHVSTQSQCIIFSMHRNQPQAMLLMLLHQPQPLMGSVGVDVGVGVVVGADAVRPVG